MPDLARAIADLYDAFPDRRDGSPVLGCPCCVGEDEGAVLGSADRRAIPEHVISLYALKAMTTWGGRDDLRSLVPPLLEGIAQGWLDVAPQIAFRKMERAEVESWSPLERGALERFLLAWMDAATHGEGWGAAEIVESAAIGGFAIEPLLSVWETADSRQSCTELAYCVIDHRWDHGNDLDDAVFRGWLASPSARAVLTRAAVTHPDDECAYLWRDAATA